MSTEEPYTIGELLNDGKLVMERINRLFGILESIADYDGTAWEGDEYFQPILDASAKGIAILIEKELHSLDSRLDIVVLGDRRD